MNHHKILKYKKQMDQDGILLGFNGIVTYESFVNLTEVLENKLKSEVLDVRTQQLIFANFVEMVQNIASYGYKTKDKESKYIELVIIGFDEELKKYFIYTGNIVNRSDKDLIVSRIEEVNNLSQDGKKALFKERLQNSKYKHEKGAGIGFLELGRRSSEPIDYNFDLLDGDRYFFSLHVSI